MEYERNPYFLECYADFVIMQKCLGAYAVVKQRFDKGEGSKRDLLEAEKIANVSIWLYVITSKKAGVIDMSFN